jgi:magnesium-transporting ATPase (P-type)
MGQYIVELTVAGFIGWFLAAHGMMKVISALLDPTYDRYDWYSPFMDVVDLILIFVGIGLAIALTVELRHPEHVGKDPS